MQGGRQCIVELLTFPALSQFSFCQLYVSKTLFQTEVELAGNTSHKKIDHGYRLRFGLISPLNI